MLCKQFPQHKVKQIYTVIQSYIISTPNFVTSALSTSEIGLGEGKQKTEI
jgi:hypothetical protein